MGLEGVCGYLDILKNDILSQNDEMLANCIQPGTCGMNKECEWKKNGPLWTMPLWKVKAPEWLCLWENCAFHDRPLAQVNAKNWLLLPQNSWENTLLFSSNQVYQITPLFESSPNRGKFSSLWSFRDKIPQQCVLKWGGEFEKPESGIQ